MTLADQIKALPSIKDEHGDECVSREAMLGIVAGASNDARRYQQLLDDPETGRHLLLLLSQKRGDQDSFRKMQDRIADSRAAAAMTPSRYGKRNEFDGHKDGGAPCEGSGQRLLAESPSTFGRYGKQGR